MAVMLCACYVAAQLWFALSVFGIPACPIDAVDDACPRPENGPIEVSSFIQGNLLKGGDELPRTKRTKKAEHVPSAAAAIASAPISKSLAADIDTVDMSTQVAIELLQQQHAKQHKTQDTKEDNPLYVLQNPAVDAIQNNAHRDWQEMLPFSFAFIPTAKAGSRWDYLITGAISWAIWMVLAFVVVHCGYTRGIESTLAAAPERSEDPIKTFNSEHFDCFSDMYTCVASCMCIGIRWADTVSQLGFLTFWSAFGLFAFLCLLNITIGGFCGLGLISACALLYYRTLLREKLQLQAWTFGTCLLDCCFVLWCPCCAVAQEARVLREAKQQNMLNFD